MVQGLGSQRKNNYLPEMRSGSKKRKKGLESTVGSASPSITSSSCMVWGLGGGVAAGVGFRGLGLCCRRLPPHPTSASLVAFSQVDKSETELG